MKQATQNYAWPSVVASFEHELLSSFKSSSECLSKTESHIKPNGESIESCDVYRLIAVLKHASDLAARSGLSLASPKMLSLDTSSC